MTRTRTWILFLLVLSSSVSVLANETTTVSVVVNKKELRYTKPCTWSVYEQSKYGLPEPVTEKIGIDKSAKLPFGSYLAVVACPSSEGTLRKAQSFQLESFQRNIRLNFNLAPAFLLVEILKDAQSLGADVWVYDQWGIRVASGIDKAFMVVPSEKLWIYASPNDEAQGRFDQKKIKTSGRVSLSPMQKKKLRLDITEASIRVKLTNNGRISPGLVTLMTQGGKSIMDWDSSEEVSVPPGVYQIAAQLAEGHNIGGEKRKAITLKPGQHHNLSLQYQTGIIRPVVTYEGQRVKEGHPKFDQIEVALHRTGAPRAFNSVVPGQRAVLVPGEYDFVAQMKEKSLDDGSPWQVKKRMNVYARSEDAVQFNLTPSSLILTTRLGDDGASSAVSLIRIDDDVKVLDGKTNAVGRATFRLPAGGYRLQVNPNPKNPKLIQEQLVDLHEGKASKVDVKVNLGRVMVQVFSEDGVALWCDVGLFHDGATKPSWVFKGGEEIWVPAGKYEIEVRREGARQAFGAVRVSAGRTAERNVVWQP